MKVFIETHGCRTNLADSSALAAELLSRGFSLAERPGEADVFIVNSCTVTAGADRDAGKALRRARRANPSALLVLLGCLPAASQEASALMAADLRLPGCAPQTISEALVSRLSEEGQARRVGRRFQLERSRGLSRVNVKIQQGCNGKCSYCIVPAARGAPVSRSIEEVQEDVRAAVEAGFREVVLAGTNIALFGCDRSSAESLAALMERLSMADPGCRLRLSSLEPDVGLSSVVSQLSSSPVWCRHLHVALQHGSDEVLALMGRDRFSFAHLASLLHDAAGAIPGLAIGLDIIVGFPGETDRLFEHCFDNLRGLPFCYLHVFSFSPRPGTLAAAMPGRPPLEVTKERSLRLRTLSDERRRDFARRQAGRRAEVLVEHRKDPSGKRLAGLTDNYLRVTMPGPDELMGSLVRSELEWAPDGYLVAVGR